MSGGHIGKLERVALREVWKHEAHDFTMWLQENVDVLNDALDLTIVELDREQNAGTFSVDLLGDDSAGRRVIVENQLERSDHDHLGKLITYLTVLDAQVAVWLVAEPRPEHVRAVAWLNESSSASFYLAKVEAIRIGDSPAAPLLTLITGPSVEVQEAGRAKKDLVEREVARLAFWTRLLDRAKGRTKLHGAISPQPYNWIGTTAGLPAGVQLNYVVRQHDAQVEIYIDAGQGSEEENQRVFDVLASHSAEIDGNSGGPLEWQSLEGKRACRIRKVIDEGGWRDEERWPTVYKLMIDAMIQLEQAVRPHLMGIQALP